MNLPKVADLLFHHVDTARYTCSLDICRILAKN